MNGDARTAASRPDHETVLLSIESRWPRDVLTWLHSLALLFGLCVVAAASVGVAVFLVVIAFDVDSQIAFWLGVIGWLVAWYRFAQQHFGVSQEKKRFFGDRVEADLLVRRDDRVVLKPYSIPFASIGTVTLRRRSELRVRFAIPHGDRRSSFDMKLPSLVGQDQMDQIVQWIEAADETHVFAWHDAGVRHYSRSWVFADVFPDVRTVDGEASFTIKSGGSTLSVAGRSFECNVHRFTQAELFELGGTSPVMAATWDDDSRSSTVRLYAGPGLEIADCDMSMRDNLIRVRFGCDVDLVWDLRAGSISLGDDPVAELVGIEVGTQMRFVQPVAEPVVLSVFLIGALLPHIFEI